MFEQAQLPRELLLRNRRDGPLELAEADRATGDDQAEWPIFPKPD
ncbi:hypothetical protein [Mesorhizobium sp. M6A.T.Cr.TU.017.01.1.1]|nr:hypothetical protein [Mesorhizobium sp. M6A.T.Cr.TU.017.01.1.1]